MDNIGLKERNMDINFNIGFLKTIRQPIFESINEALKNIKDNLSLVKDNKVQSGTALTMDAIALVHKANGALKMIDLPGAVLILQSVEDLLKSIKEGNLNSKIQQGLYVAEKALTDLALYIEQLCDGELDKPVKLFNHYKNLCLLLNKNADVKDLFYPKIDLLRANQHQIDSFFKLENSYDEKKLFAVTTQLKALISNTAFEKNILDLCTVVEQVKTASENSTIAQVASVMFVQGLQNKISTLKEFLEKIQDLNINKHWHIMLEIEKSFFSCMEPNINDSYISFYTENYKQIRFNLLKLSVELLNLHKKLGEIAASKNDFSQAIKQIKSEKSVQKEVLYSICLAVLNNPKLKETNQIAKLNNLINLDLYVDQLELTNFSASIIQKDPDSVAFLEKILIDLKEEFVLLTTKANNTDPANYLKKFYTLTSKFNDQLTSLQVEIIKPVVSSLLETILKITTKQVEFSDIVKEEFSLTINFIDRLVETYVKSVATVNEAEDVAQVELLNKRLAFIQKTGGKEAVKLPLPVLSKATLENEKIKVNTQIFTQLADDLNKAEDIIDEFFRKKGENITELSFVIQALNSARGILSMTGKKDLSLIVVDAIKTFESLIKDVNSVSSDDVKKASSYIAGIMVYVLALKNANHQEAANIYYGLLELRASQNPQEIVMPPVISIKTVEPVLADVKKPEAAKPTFEETLVLDLNTKTTPAVKAVEATPVEHKSLLSDSEFNFTISAPKEPEKEGTIHPKLLDQTNNEELADIFIMEAEEVLEALEQDLVNLEKAPADTEIFKTVRRHFHTLKGSARMVGFRYFAEAAWLVEQTLNKVIESGNVPDKKAFAMMNFCVSLTDKWTKELQASSDKTVYVELDGMLEVARIVNPKADFSFDIYEKAEETAQVETLEVIPELPVLAIEEETPVVSEPEVKAEVKIEVPMLEIEGLEEVQKSIPEEEHKIVELEDFALTAVEPLEMVKASPAEEKIVEKNLSRVEEIPEFTFSNIVIDESEVKAEEVAVEPVEALEEEYINIGHAKISLQLYNLFDKESAEHIENIDKFLLNNKSKKVLAFNDDFTRYVHTLGSISGSVNLNLIHDLAGKLENISRMAVEKNYEIDTEQYFLIDRTISKIKEIKAVLGTHEDDDFIILLSDLGSIEEKIAAFESENNGHAASVLDIEETKPIMLNTDEEEQLEKELQTNQGRGNIMGDSKEEQLNFINTLTESIVNALTNKFNSQLEAIASENAQLKADLIEKNNQLIEQMNEQTKLSQQILELVGQASGGTEGGFMTAEHNTSTGNDSSNAHDNSSDEKLVKEITEKLSSNMEEIKEHNKRVMLNGLGIIRKDIQNMAEQKKGFFR